MDKEQLKQRTKKFAHRCVKLALCLPASVLGNHVRQQLIRCSTSVGANYRAVCMAQSKATFIAQQAIVLEEADESCFWMEFIIDELLIVRKKVVPLLEEGKQLVAIFVASQKTARRRGKAVRENVE